MRSPSLSEPSRDTETLAYAGLDNKTTALGMSVISSMQRYVAETGVAVHLQKKSNKLLRTQLWSLSEDGRIKSLCFKDKEGDFAELYLTFHDWIFQERTEETTTGHVWLSLQTYVLLKKKK